MASGTALFVPPHTPAEIGRSQRSVANVSEGEVRDLFPSLTVERKKLSDEDIPF
jgi:hypothetical protein